MQRRLLALVASLALCAAGSVARSGPPDDAAPAGVDVVVLRDGRRIEGEVLAEDDRFLTVRSAGVTRAYAKDSVESVTRAAKSPPSPDSGAPGGSASGPEPAPARPDAPGRDRGRKGRAGGTARAPAPLGPEAQAWLESLIARTATGDEAVRRSVGAAILELGPAALPTLRGAAAAVADGPQKQLLDRLVAALSSDRRPGSGGPPGAEPAQVVERLTRELTSALGLREDQRPRVQGILTDTLRRRFEAVREARRSGLDPARSAERTAAVRADLLARMKEVLDGAQYSLFEPMADRILAGGAERGPKGAKPPGTKGAPKPEEPAKPEPKDAPKPDEAPPAEPARQP